MSERLKGKIKWMNCRGDFGFILSGDNKEVFFHKSDCLGFFPIEGLQIDFEIGLDKQDRKKAVNIKSASCAGVSDGTDSK